MIPVLKCFESKTTDFQPALITAAVAILVFIVGRIIDSEFKRKERLHNWYFKTVIDPTLSKIDSQLDELLKLFKSSKDKILECHPTDLIILKSHIFGEYDMKVRDLSIELFSLVKITHPNLMLELDDLFNDFDDFKSMLDNDNILKSPDSENKFRYRLYDLKSEIYRILYKPISPIGSSSEDDPYA